MWEPHNHTEKTGRVERRNNLREKKKCEKFSLKKSVVRQLYIEIDTINTIPAAEKPEKARRGDRLQDFPNKAF